MTYNYKSKSCIRCRVIYSPRSSSQKVCKECREARSREVKKEWGIKNKQHLAKKNKEWYWKNLGKARQIKRRWNLSESGKIYRKNYYNEHKDQVYKSLEKHKDRSYARIKSARILKRTGIEWVCSNCGDASKKPVVHHIDENPFNMSLENLILLCRDCHADIHHDLNLARSLVQ